MCMGAGIFSYKIIVFIIIINAGSLSKYAIKSNGNGYYSANSTGSWRLIITQKADAAIRKSKHAEIQTNRNANRHTAP